MDPNLQIRGEGAVIQNLRLGWGSLKNIFSWPFGPQFGPNMRGGGGGWPPRLLPWIHHCRWHCEGYGFHVRLEQYIELLINLDINTAIAMEDQ